MNNRKCYPFHMDHVPASFLKKAENELNETPETKKLELQRLIDLISADKFTTGIKFEEDFLQQFLRYRKYSSSKAFEALRKFVNFRKNFCYLFQAIPDVYFKDNPSTKYLSVLPYRCPEGCVIILHEFGKWNPNELPLDEMETMAMYSFFQSLRYPMTQICGLKMICDFKDTIKLLRYSTPENISVIYNAAFNCVPGRFKEVHCINESVFLTAIWTVMRLFLPEKIRKRIFFHSNPEDVLNYFPSSIIPTQYGGSLDHYQDSELMRKLNAEYGNFPQEGQPNYF